MTKKEETVGNMEENGKLGKVTIKCGVPSGWTVYDDKIGRRIIKLGDIVTFDPTDRRQLHCLIQIIKIVNNDDINEIEYKEPGSRKKTLTRKKFEILEGLETLPKVIQKMKMSDMKYTDAEANAIEKLVPDYFKREDVLYKIKR